jgi:hypothetical protein
LVADGERGPGRGQQLAGEAFLTGLDRQRADVAGQQLTPVPGLAVTIDLDATDVEVYGRKKGGVPGTRTCWRTWCAPIPISCAWWQRTVT